MRSANTVLTLRHNIDTRHINVALPRYAHMLKSLIDDGSSVDIIYMYLYFQKVFHNFPHQRLIPKLKSRGMGNYNYDQPVVVD